MCDGGVWQVIDEEVDTKSQSMMIVQHDAPSGVFVSHKNINIKLKKSYLLFGGGNAGGGGGQDSSKQEDFHCYGMLFIADARAVDDVGCVNCIEN